MSDNDAACVAITSALCLEKIGITNGPKNCTEEDQNTKNKISYETYCSVNKRTKIFFAVGWSIM